MMEYAATYSLNTKNTKRRMKGPGEDDDRTDEDSEDEEAAFCWLIVRHISLPEGGSQCVLFVVRRWGRLG